MNSQIEDGTSASQKETSSISVLGSPSEDNPAPHKVPREQLTVDHIKKIREERAQKRQIRRS